LRAPAEGALRVLRGEEEAQGLVGQDFVPIHT